MSGRVGNVRFSEADDALLRETVGFVGGSKISWVKVADIMRRKGCKQSMYYCKRRWEIMNDTKVVPGIIEDVAEDECPEFFVAEHREENPEPRRFSAAEDNLLLFITDRHVGTSPAPWSIVSRFMKKHTLVDRSEYLCKTRLALLNNPNYNADEQRNSKKIRKRQWPVAMLTGTTSTVTGTTSTLTGTTLYRYRRDLFMSSSIFELVARYQAAKKRSLWSQQTHWLKSFPATTYASVPLAEFLLRGTIAQTSGAFVDAFKCVDISVNGNTSSLRLPALTALPLAVENQPDGGMDMALNICAPVWCVAFNPLPASSSGSARYLAVGTTRIGWPEPGAQTACPGDAKPGDTFNKLDTSMVLDGMDSDAPPVSGGLGGDRVYVAGQCDAQRHPNMIQIWKVEVGEEGDDGGAQSARCLYSVGIDGCGPIWSLAWCPDVPSDGEGAAHEGSAIGLLAVVGGNGSCVVYVMPHERCVSMQGTSPDVAQSRLRVVPSSSLRRWEIAMGAGDCGVRVSSAAWHVRSPPSPGELGPSTATTNLSLLCGMADGSWTFWPLDIAAHTDSASSQLGVTLSKPLRKFSDLQCDKTIPGSSAITSIAMCPYNPDLVATGGFGSSLNIWCISQLNGNVCDSSDVFRPIYRNSGMGGWILDIQWDVHGYGVYYTCSASAVVFRDVLFYEPGANVSVYRHALKTCCVWKTTVFSYDSQSVVASVASDGTCRSSIISSTLRAKNSDEFCIFQGQHVEQVDPYIGSCSTNSSSNSSAGTVHMNLEEQLLKPSEFRGENSRVEIANPRCSLNAIDNCSLGPKRTLLATGGSSGIVRIKMVVNIENMCP